MISYFLLENKMNTSYGKNEARKRHEFMEKFLIEFYREIGKEENRAVKK